MKAYCINLDRRPDRLIHMQDQFARLGMPFERVPAVDSEDPAVAAAAAQCRPSTIDIIGLRMHAGAYGCFQSHREVWRRLLASGESHAMVLEDDLVLADGLAGYLEEDWLPGDADIVRLETYLLRFHRDKGPGTEALGRRLYRLRSSQSGTGCYIISAGAARRLLAATETITDPIDEVLFNQGSSLFDSLTTYQMVPAPVIQGDRVKQPDRPGWSATSIAGRVVLARQAGVVRGETLAGRLIRRLREELRAGFMGTRYVVVPFG